MKVVAAFLKLGLGSVEDNAHRILASQSRLFQAFVFTLESEEKPLSHTYMAENGNRIRIAALPIFLYTRTYLAQKSFERHCFKLISGNRVAF